MRKMKKIMAILLASVLSVSSLPQTTAYAVQETEYAVQETEYESVSETEEIYESKTLSEESVSETEETEESKTLLETEEETESVSETEYNSEEEKTLSESVLEYESVSETEYNSEEEKTLSESESVSESKTLSEESVLEYICPEMLEPEYIPYDENQEKYTDRIIKAQSRDVIASEYDARKEGYLPAVRNQGNWGTCWSFALTGAMEVSMVLDLNKSADSVDLSERHLAYFAYNTGYDELDNANDDTMTQPGDYYLQNGGNDIRGVIRLMNWNAGASESSYPYVTGTMPEALERVSAQDAEVYLEGAYRYDFSSAEDKTEAIRVIKQMIMDYGAVSWSYYHDTAYSNSSTGAYYNNDADKEGKTNHAIMAVGWDDNYSKENFKEGARPQNDGAWIIRNSWGDKNGDEGYLYMSYEDVSLGSGNPAYAFTVCDKSKYDNNYFYGNTACSGKLVKTGTAAQVYRIKSENAVRESIKAVSFLIATSYVDYEIQLYKNPDMVDGVVKNPESGTPLLSTPQTGQTGYSGLYTVEIDEQPVLDTDDYVSVVIKFPNTKPFIYFDRSYTSSDGQCTGVHVVREGRSFDKTGNTGWRDNYQYDRTYRINMLTSDSSDVVEIPEIKEIKSVKAQSFQEFPKVTVKWSKCTNADGYRLYRSENAADYTLVAEIESSIREYTETLNERADKEYTYRVEAVYGDTAKSSEAVKHQVDGMIEPSVLTLSEYDGYTAVFSWEKIFMADGYELWKLNGDGDDAAWEHVADYTADDTLSYTADTSEWELGKYYYRMRAKYNGEYTQWSISAINRDLIWSQRSYYTAHFEWLPVENAETYNLYHKVNGRTFFTKLTKDSANITMKSSSYYPCDEHEYYLKAYAQDGSLLATTSTIKFRMTPDKPEITGAEYDYSSSVRLTWSGVEGTDKLEIYKSEDASQTGVWIDTADAQSSGFTDTDVYKGKKYYYTLVPVSESNDGTMIKGEPSVSYMAETFPKSAIPKSAQYAEGSGVEFEWESAAGADGYLIERSSNGGEYTELVRIKDGKTTLYTDMEAEKGNSYQYRVMTLYITQSGMTETIPAEGMAAVSILPQTVEFSGIKELERSGDKTQVELLWELSEKAQHYTVYRGVVTTGSEADEYIKIADELKAGSYVDNTALPDTKYSYKLLVTLNGLTSDLEKTTGVTIATKPVLTALEMTSGQIELVRDGELSFGVAPVPAHYPYEEELVWSAYDINGNKLEIIRENERLSVRGTDTKEILWFDGSKLHAVCESETVDIVLKAAIDEISAESSIFVYNDGFWVHGIKDLTYTGKPLTQSIKVYDKNRLLTEGKDYTVSYKNNVKVSSDITDESKKPTVVVKGKGSYTGTQTLHFEILPEPPKDADRKSVLNTKIKSIGSFTYSGNPVEPKPVVRDGKITLEEEKDYTLSYENNDAPGNATVIITGINAYKGVKRLSFKITYNIQSDECKLMRAEFDKNTAYVKGGSRPIPKVYCADTLLTEGVDYRLSYKNNKAIASASDEKAPVVIITGKGSYKGKLEETFNIVRADMEKLTLTADDRVYSQKPGAFMTGFVITDTDGKKLSPGKDYDKASVEYTYADTGEPLDVSDVAAPGTTLCITVKALENGMYSGAVKGEYRIVQYDISKAKISVKAQIFTGSEIKPDSETGLTVSYNGEILTEGVDYTVAGYENNVGKGTAKLHIKGIGDFGGRKTAKFKIKTRILKWWWQS